MNMTRAIGLFLLITISLVAGFWAAGVILLSKFNGTPWTSGITPLTWIQHFIHYHDYPQMRLPLMTSGYTGLLFFFTILIFGCWIGMRFGDGNKQKQHGDARFATKKEIKKTGLINDTGIIIGKHAKQTLRYSGNEFVLLSAPTRGGKGVSVVIPNALDYPESLVVMDVKGENQEITSKYRKSLGHDVYCFNPYDDNGRTHGYNPLHYIRTEGRHRMGDLRMLGSMIYPPGGQYAFFQDTARDLFIGLGLYLFETPGLPRSIGEMLRQASGKGMPPPEYLLDIIESRERTKTPLSEECKDAFNRYLSANDDLKASIMQSFFAPITMFADPIFDAATSTNDFDFRDLRRRKMTIYFGIPVSRMDESALLVNMFWSQLIAMNTQELPSKNRELKYKVVLLMDEMPMMGRVAILAKGSAFIAGYNLRLVTIVQSPQQLFARPPEGYGEQTARALISNHSCKLIFTPDEQVDAENISKMLGTYTYKARSLSYGQKNQKNFTLSASGSQSDQRRELMLPQELREMPYSQQLILVKGHKPILADKVTYYDDPYYINMLKSVSPYLYSLGTRIPTQDEFEYAWANNELMIDIPLIDIEAYDAQKFNVTKSPSIEELDSITSKSIATDVSGIFSDINGTLSEQHALTTIKAILGCFESQFGNTVQRTIATINGTEPDSETAESNTSEANEVEKNETSSNSIEQVETPVLATATVPTMIESSKKPTINEITEGSTTVELKHSSDARQMSIPEDFLEEQEIDNLDAVDHARSRTH